MKQERLDLSVIVPVYNEEGNIEALFEELRRVLEALGSTYEVVFVDDGSTDHSLSIVRELVREHTNVRCVALERNAGQSAALDAGFRASQGKVLVTLDADLQNDPRDIPKLLDALKSHDVAVGWRTIRHDSLAKRLASRVGNGVRNWATHEHIHDTGCSLKACRRAATKALPLFTGMHRFLPTLFQMHGFSVVQVPVSHRPRQEGQSKYGVLDRLRATVPDLLAVRWMQKRRLRYRIAEELP